MPRRFLVILALAVASAAIAAQNHQSPPSAGKDDPMVLNLFPLSQTKWTDGPASLPKGAQIAVLEGDPAKDGPFVFRVKMPDGYRIPPHTHPKTERVTVIAGTFNVGMGEKFDEKTAQSLPTGTFGYWPAGMTHFAWTKGETVLQLHGIGPWSIQYVNPQDDPRTAKN